MDQMQQIASETDLRYRNIRMFDQFKTKRNWDIILRIEDQEVPAHSNVLCAASAKIEELLQELEEQKLDRKELVLEHFTISSFEFLAPFIYKGTLNWEELRPDNYKDVMLAAQHYGFDSVLKKMKSLTTSVSPADENIAEIFGNLADNNSTVIKKIVMDCFGDVFGFHTQINCMLCSEKLNLNDVDQVIKHCWQHKLSASGVTQIMDEMTNDEEEFPLVQRGPERLQLNIEINDDYEFTELEGDQFYSEEEEEISYNDFEMDTEIHHHMTDHEMRQAQTEDILYNGHFNLRPTSKKRRYDMETGSGKRKCFTHDHPCPVCNKKFKYPKALESHLKFCKAAQSFCDAAGNDKKVFTKKGLIDNILTGKFHFNDENAKNQMLDYLTTSEPKEKKSWPCPLCPDEIFYKKRDQVNHIKLRHGQIKRFICDKCNKPFPTKTALYSHIRRHTGEKPYHCTDCKATFAEKKSMEDHLRRHTGEKPFLCQECGKEFTFRQSLYRHMKFHEGKRPFKCPQCGKDFVLKQNLQDHMQRHAKQKQFKCGECAQLFGDEMQLRQHRNEYHALTAAIEAAVSSGEQQGSVVQQSRVEVAVGHDQVLLRDVDDEDDVDVVVEPLKRRAEFVGFVGAASSAYDVVDDDDDDEEEDEEEDDDGIMNDFN